MGISAAAPPAEQPTSEHLLADFERTGRECAFEELIRRHADAVYAACFAVTRNRHDAEDAAQAVFLTLAVQARTVNGITNVGGWLHQVARRTSLDLIRSRKRRVAREHVRAADDSDRFEHEHPAQVIGAREAKALLREEIGRLPVKYRLPLILHYFGGMTPQEVSTELRCSPRTLAVRLFRARKLLSDQLRGRGILVGGTLLSLAVAGSILSALADALANASASTPPAAPAVACGVLRITRACAAVTMKSRLALALVFMVSATLAAPAVRDFASEIPAPAELLSHVVEHATRSLSGLGRYFRSNVPSISQATPAPDAAEISPQRTARPSPFLPPPALAPDRVITLYHPVEAPAVEEPFARSLATSNARPSWIAAAEPTHTFPQPTGPVTLSGAESKPHHDVLAFLPSAPPGEVSPSPTQEVVVAAPVDTVPLGLLPIHFGGALPISDPTPASIPEPSGMLLLAGAALLLLRRARPRPCLRV